MRLPAETGRSPTVRKNSNHRFLLLSLPCIYMVANRVSEKTDTLKKSQKSLIKKANQRIIEFLFRERAKKEGREHNFPTSNQPCYIWTVTWPHAAALPKPSPSPKCPAGSRPAGSSAHAPAPPKSPGHLVQLHWYWSPAPEHSQGPVSKDKRGHWCLPLRQRINVTNPDK